MRIQGLDDDPGEPHPGESQGEHPSRLHQEHRSPHHRHRRAPHREHLTRYVVVQVKCKFCGYMNSLEYSSECPVARVEWDALRCEKCGHKIAAHGPLGYAMLRLRCSLDTLKRRLKRWRRRQARSWR